MHGVPGMSLSCPECGAEVFLRLASGADLNSTSTKASPRGQEPYDAADKPPDEVEVDVEVSEGANQPPVEGELVTKKRYSYQDKGFEAFWKVYPRHVAKASSFSRWKIVTREIDPDVVIAAAARYAESCRGIEAKFIKYPDGWLLAGRWDDDEIAPPPEAWASDPAWVVGTPEYAARQQAEEDAAIAEML